MVTLFSEIRPDERRQTIATFFVLFGITAGHALLETARDALFLARLPASHLAWVYLAIAAVTLALFVFQERRRRHQSRAGLQGWLVTAATVNVLFWLLVARPGTATLYALYTWSGVFSSLVILRYWTLVGELFTIGQAKRVFALIGTGGVLGAVFGSAVSRVLATGLDPRHFLLVSAVLLLITAAGPVRRLPRQEAEAESAAIPAMEWFDLKRPLTAVWSRPYLRRIGAIVLISSITFTLVDYLFKGAVAENIPPEQLGSFFAGAYLALNGLSLVAQLVAVGWMLRALSVSRVLSVLPLLFLGGTTGILLGGGLLAAFILKGFDGALRHSLHRTALEVLYVPLTGDARSRIKGFIDVLGQRGGQALASIVILATSVLTGSRLLCVVAVLILAAVWIRIAMTLESHYLDLFRETLKEVALQKRFDFPEMDLASLETLLMSLNSADDSEVIAALDLFAQEDRVHLVPALVLFHPSREVVLRALELFTLSGRQDFLTILGRLFLSDHPEVRAAALRANTWSVGPRPDLYEQFTTDPSPIVRATANVGLLSYASGAAAEAARTAIEHTASGSSEERLALAHAIRYSPGAGYKDVLCKLAGSADPEVQLAVVRAMREVLSTRFIPVLIQLLPRRVLRRDTRATLVAIGTEALSALGRALADPEPDPRVRLHIPRAVGFFPPVKAAPVLVRHLAGGEDADLDYRILQALNRCRNADPELTLDGEVLRRRLSKVVSETFQLIEWRLTVDQGARRDPARATPVQQVLLALLADKELRALERMFRLLGLLYPGEDSRSLYRGARSTSRKVRDSSRELLEKMLQPPLKGVVLALIDDVPDAERMRRAGGYHRRRDLDYAAALADLLAHGDLGLRCLAAHHVGELGLLELRDDVNRLGTGATDVVGTAAGYSLAMLDQSEALADGT